MLTSKAKTQVLSLKELQGEGVTVMAEPQRSSPAQIRGQIRMEGMQYLTEIPEAPQLTYSQLLSARLSALKETSWVDMAADVSGGTFFTKGQSHFVVHEAFLSTHGNQPLKGYAGRKKMDWSELD
ncbi:MAG: transposase, partial [Bdellovibrio sp.]